jgi:hypothetical protein
MRSPGGGVALNSSGGDPWRVGHAEDACPVGLGWRRRSPGRGRREVGDDPWAPLVNDRGRGRRRSDGLAGPCAGGNGSAALLGQLGRPTRAGLRG